MAQFPSFASISNISILEELYANYVKEPTSVEPSWRFFFEGVDFSGFRQGETDKWIRSLLLIEAYRRHGHLLAKVNSIALEEPKALELELATLGFKESELEESFPTHGFLATSNAPLKNLLEALQAIYCGKIGFEFMDIDNQALGQWLHKRLEPRLEVAAPPEVQKLIIEYLNRSELFESFLHTKYVGQKRFSIEGCDTLMPMLAYLIETGASMGMDEFVLGMAHRGRLNVLANLLNKPYSVIFREFEDKFLPLQFEGSGDVKYHKGFSSKGTTSLGKDIYLHLAANSSCLESVDPVALGMTYARQILSKDQDKKRVGAVLIHGDASLAGQGVVYESLQLMRLPGYSTGGTIHIVVNNQVGFTTPPSQGRSTRYCTDIAKTFGCPVFHVNAEDPEGCLFAVKLAVEIRLKFQCDVFIDLNGYRKYGHNEGDEPVFMQPREYQLIRSKKSIRDLYAGSVDAGAVFKETLAAQFELSKGETLPSAEERYGVAWKEFVQPPTSMLFEPFITNISAEIATQVMESYCRIPQTFHLNPKLIKWVEDRRMMLKKDAIDWSAAECLAFGSLLLGNTPVRLCGQDSQRGTFSQRHAVWIDQENGQAYSPFSGLEVYNSPLSEFACLAFEYGYSWVILNGLNLWEAQYGDFTIGAETVIDHYFTTAEQKWARYSSLTLLLPHGYEGQGPEHSSGRIERFLQLCAKENIQVANPTTPAQYFHLLRRQALRPIKKPLVIFTPKSLLRLPTCISSLASFTQGTFEEVLNDPISPKNPRRLLLCSGKIFYELAAQKQTDIAIVRLEQLYPIHRKKLEEMLRSYASCSDVCWVQEEPQNMGAWEFIYPHIQALLPKQTVLRYIGRERSAVTATGSFRQHTQELERILKEAFA